MTLWIILGDVGTGKTLIETDIALKSKVPVLSNYKIGKFEMDNEGEKHFIEWQKGIEPLEIDQLFNLPYKKCKILLDECYAYLESRTSMSKLNLYMSYVLFQSRKRGLDIICTAQLSGTIDNRFLSLADYFIVCQAVKDGFQYFISDRTNVKIVKFPFRYVEKFWDKYDTTEVIMPPNIGDLQTQVEAMDRKKLKPKIDELATKFMNEYPQKVKVTRALVRGFLLDIDENELYEEYLYPRLIKETAKNKEES